MKSALRLTTRQQLALTPQIRHTIRMLQLGARELAEEIDQVLEKNPLLEEKPAPKQSAGEDDAYSNWLQNQADDRADSLEQHLIGQLGFARLQDKDYLLACLVITQLEDDGYLRLGERQLLAQCADERVDASLEDLQAAIGIVRSLEPAGVASRDLGDCLGMQLVRNVPDSPAQKHALRLCQQLDLLASAPDRLQSRLGLDEEAFRQARDVLATLDPAPGKAFDQQPTRYIQPDILLTMRNTEIEVRLNPVINRGIDLNQYYIDLLKTSDKASDREYLRQNLDNARWWLNALQQRNRTLLAVARQIIEHQAAYFEQGSSALRPLKQQDIADSLNLNISTVSRAINGKYIQASAGVVKLASLLAGSISTENNISLSNEAVRFMIENIIKNESSQTPLSDSKIVGRLNKKGIIIARRTVAKYRDQLNIPPSNRRKLH